MTENKFLLENGVKISLDWFKAEALKTLKKEKGIKPATLLREILLEPDNPRVVQQRNMWLGLAKQLEVDHFSQRVA